MRSQSFAMLAVASVIAWATTDSPPPVEKPVHFWTCEGPLMSEDECAHETKCSNQQQGYECVQNEIEPAGPCCCPAVPAEYRVHDESNCRVHPSLDPKTKASGCTRYCCVGAAPRPCDWGCCKQGWQCGKNYTTHTDDFGKVVYGQCCTDMNLDVAQQDVNECCNWGIGQKCSDPSRKPCCLDCLPHFRGDSGEGLYCTQVNRDYDCLPDCGQYVPPPTPWWTRLLKFLTKLMERHGEVIAATLVFVIILCLFCQPRLPDCKVCCLRCRMGCRNIFTRNTDRDQALLNPESRAEVTRVVQSQYDIERPEGPPRHGEETAPLETRFAAANGSTEVHDDGGRVMPNSSKVQSAQRWMDQPHDQGKRKALVIYNSKYHHSKHFEDVPTARNDGKKMVELLKNLGYDVLPFIDATFAEMKALEKMLIQHISGLARELVFVYYAGHGLEVCKEQLLVPVDATMELKCFLSLSKLVNNLLATHHKRVADENSAEPAQNLLFVFCLDSCKKPWEPTDFKESELAAFTKEVETRQNRYKEHLKSRFVFFTACQNGGLAQDDGEHGLFTKAFLNAAENRDNSLQNIIDKVKKDVEDWTRRMQQTESNVRIQTPNVEINYAGALSEATFLPPHSEVWDEVSLVVMSARRAWISPQDQSCLGGDRCAQTRVTKMPIDVRSELPS